MSIADKILLFRAKHNLTQTELAKMAGMSRTTIQVLEKTPCKAKKVTVLKLELLIENMEA